MSKPVTERGLQRLQLLSGVLSNITQYYTTKYERFSALVRQFENLPCFCLETVIYISIALQNILILYNAILVHVEIHGFESDLCIGSNLSWI